ncbi:MAG: 4-hydroxythreonine-4-phosphate dehydrogenase PdxA [Prevotella sp.]|nr:4-hydroxythreonine-4-phosphate dehydrogenase PdxA [Prevotella sp.]
MEQERKPRVAITHGDTNGVGYELIFKIFDDPEMLELCTPIIYGSPKVATYHRKALNMQTQFSIISTASDAKENRLNLLTTFDEEIKVEIGQPSEEATDAARKALKRAIVDVQQGLADVLVMAPDNLPDFLSKEPEVLRIRIAEDLRIALITNQMAIKDVPEAITKQKIVEKGKIMHTCLRRDLRISSPRIAVLSLNPPTGNETDPWGEEEKEMIIPAIDELAQMNIQAFGPCFADTFFGNGYYTKFDGVLAMYHDQGMAPLKTLAQEESVNLSTGMPFVCTSPEIGVQYDVAGKGCADEAPLRRAIYLGIDVFRNRINYDEPLGNPLPKLYKEKRDDSEKVRFAVPKFKDKEETEKE